MYFEIFIIKITFMVNSRVKTDFNFIFFFNYDVKGD